MVSDRLIVVPVFSLYSKPVCCIGPVYMLVEQDPPVRSFSVATSPVTVWILCHPSISDTVFSILRQTAGSLSPSFPSLTPSASVAYDTSFSLLSIRGSHSWDLLQSVFRTPLPDEASLADGQLLSASLSPSPASSPYYAPEFASQGPGRRSRPPQVFSPRDAAELATAPAFIPDDLPDTRVLLVRRSPTRLGRAMSGCDVIVPRSALPLLWRRLCGHEVVVVGARTP